MLVLTCCVGHIILVLTCCVGHNDYLQESVNYCIGYVARVIHVVLCLGSQYKCVGVVISPDGRLKSLL